MKLKFALITSILITAINTTAALALSPGFDDIPVDIQFNASSRRFCTETASGTAQLSADLNCQEMCAEDGFVACGPAIVDNLTTGYFGGQCNANFTFDCDCCLIKY